MEPIALDPGDYGGSYKLIGGRAPLDLVNTVSWPETERRHDWLSTEANLVRWLEAVGLPSTAVPITERTLHEIKELRAVLAQMLSPLAGGSRPTALAVLEFNRHLARALARRRLDAVDLSWSWRTPEDILDVLSPVVLDAADLIASGDHSRLKQCPSCGWLFEDQTKNGRRRWCDMADCGSRAKSRAYYHRTKGTE